jgi:alpha-mannosidase
MAPPSSRATLEYPETNFGAGAKWVKHLTQDRINQFTGGHFGDVNLSTALYTERLDSDKYVKLELWSAPGLTKPSFEEAMKQKFKKAGKGEVLGPSCELVFVL